jgi:peptidoglycan/LPS O-acetylase OafA/YrhL
MTGSGLRSDLSVDVFTWQAARCSAVSSPKTAIPLAYVKWRSVERLDKMAGMGPLRQHTNAFDLIRLVAAGLVLWSHQHALMGLREPSVDVLGASYGGLGVYIFFAISGYLNTRSLAQHRSVRVFLLSRALRIYPALAACVVFTVILGFLVATDREAYLSVKLLSYIAKNVTLFSDVEVGVPGVFESNKFPEVLNGSLWTLPYEVKMYVMLVLCLAAMRYNLVLPIIVFAGAALIAILGTVGLLPALPRNNFWVIFSTLFLAGSAVGAAQAFAGLPVAIGAIAAMALAFAGIGEKLLAWQLLLTGLVIAVGCIAVPKRLRLPLDLSYGIYLYAFPIQQVSATLFTDFWRALAFSTIITLVLALMSALFIERYALQLKNLPAIPWVGKRSALVRADKVIE